MKTVTNLLPITLAFLMGTVISLGTTLALAHGGDTSLLHGCVLNTLGTVRIVGASTNCLGTEAATDWKIQGQQGATGPQGPSAYTPAFVCTFHCWFSDSAVASKFKNQDLSYAFLRQFELKHTDASNIILNHADINGDFTDSNLTGANFSNSLLSVNLTNTNLTNANFSSATVSATFTNANFQNANLTNATVVSSNFSGATNMNTASISGVIWNTNSEDYSLCPDETTSYDNGNTCIGHLTP